MFVLNFKVKMLFHFVMNAPHLLLHEVVISTHRLVCGRMHCPVRRPRKRCLCNWRFAFALLFSLRRSLRSLFFFLGGKQFLNAVETVASNSIHLRQ